MNNKTYNPISIGRKNAIALAKTNWWKSLSAQEIVNKQFFTAELCMDMGDFQNALETVLGRSVWTHELACPENIYAEMKDEIDPPTIEDIINMIPEDKRIVIET